MSGDHTWHEMPSLTPEKPMFKDGLAKLNERAAEIKSAKLRDEQIAKNTALRNRFVGAAMGGLYSGSSRQNEDENNYSK